MKDFSKSELCSYFLCLVASIMTINSFASLLRNSYKFNFDDEVKQPIEDNFDDFYSVVSRFAYSNNAIFNRLEDGSYVLFMKDSYSELKLVNNNVLVSSYYIDGYFEENSRSLNGFDVDVLKDSITHRVVNKVVKKEEEQSIVDRSKVLVLNSSYFSGISEEKMMEISSIIENLLFLFSKYDDISYNDKEQFIVLAFKVSQDQLDAVVPVCIREGDSRDCAAVTVNVLNRLFSYVWTQQAIDNMGLDKNFDEVNIYDLISSEGQYQVYDEKTYLLSYGDKESDAYKSVIDTLFACLMRDEEVYHFHDYLEFVAPTLTPNGGYKPEQFVKNGNKHYRHQKDNDRIPLEESILKDFFAVVDILDSEGILDEVKNSQDSNILSLYK